MSDQQANKEALPPPGSMICCQTQNQVIQLKFEWTFQHFAFLNSFEKWGDYYDSSEFHHENTTRSRWILRLFGQGNHVKVNLNRPYFNNTNTPLETPVRVTIALLSTKREKIFSQHHSLPRYTQLPFCVYQIEKKVLVESECFVNGKLTIDCEIESFIAQVPVILSGKPSTEAAYIPEKSFSNSDQLVAQLEELYDNMKFSDITVNVRGRRFQAHKNILATRSTVFAAMFEHPTKENLTHQVEIKDVDPAVFGEILRYIYTGRLSESTMRKMSAGILAAADKYLLEQLKMECETQLIHRMSAENCLELLLITDEHHPAFHLKKYAVEFFRRFSGEVMATDEWEKTEKSHPELCLTILKLLVKSLV
ncbi:speckle-type POZ protein B-like [Daphnia pulex]|uniref:speckle-type POZ protein B-like n=1 Tax=Daphnia pulex TaxID=6669 RepID=UPI001EDDC0D8|nr:speckle-type POZ protein B-like [Daphnia pulex]